MRVVGHLLVYCRSEKYLRFLEDIWAAMYFLLCFCRSAICETVLFYLNILSYLKLYYIQMFSYFRERECSLRK